MTDSSNNQSAIANCSSPKSWHHRMARLELDSYNAKCQARGCKRAADYICEYDFMRGGKPVSDSKVLCLSHAGHFAGKHRIDFGLAPTVLHSQIERADRDNWAYGEDIQIIKDRSGALNLKEIVKNNG